MELLISLVYSTHMFGLLTRQSLHILLNGGDYVLVAHGYVTRHLETLIHF